MPKLTVTKTNERIVLSGYTYPLRDKIKEMGGRWDAATKTWSLAVDADVNLLYAEEKVAKEQEKAAVAAWRFANPPAYGRCCADAKCEEQYFMGPSCITCPHHGKRPTTSKGFGYTGD